MRRLAVIRNIVGDALVSPVVVPASSPLRYSRSVSRNSDCFMLEASHTASGERMTGPTIGFQTLITENRRLMSASASAEAEASSEADAAGLPAVVPHDPSR